LIKVEKTFCIFDKRRKLFSILIKVEKTFCIFDKGRKTFCTLKKEKKHSVFLIKVEKNTQYFNTQCSILCLTVESNMILRTSS
jgi:deoxycytidine triphosphate deaminase